jgi:phosphoenolpyruvate-protein phosphotransferase (PTS system enzyme I)
MAQSRELRGRPAAPGVVLGPLLRLGVAIEERKPTGNPQDERRALTAAIAAAIGDLGDLRARAGDTEGGALLDFQIAMLEDDSLRAPALEAIDNRAAAGSAWSAALAGQIAEYEAAEDEYFRARASDLRDMRDRVLGHLAGVARGRLRPDGAVVLAEDIAPSLFLETDWSAGGGLALTAGSPTSHVAMLARARGIPMVVGLEGGTFDGHEEILIDGSSGVAILSPNDSERRAAEIRRRSEAAQAQCDAARLGAPAITADGVRITVMLNVVDPAELTPLDPSHSDGVGLVRTEFLCRTQGGVFDEAIQYDAYCRIVEWAAGRPVTVRTLDAGGDKPIPGFTIDGESNPFLGVRGIRLSLARPDALLIQLRALVRAAASGPLKIMLPMVTVPRELADASRLLDTALAEVAARGLPARRPPLGIMVEVPAAALDITSFAADFFSIGSNDLTQYVTACSRDSGSLAALNDPRNPAVMRLIAEVAWHGAQSGIEVSLCGDAAGEPDLIPDLLAAGLRTLSVAPAALARTKAAIATCRLGKIDG